MLGCKFIISLDMGDNLKKIRDRLRITLILYTFSEPVQIVEKAEVAKVFYTEIKIQALDFLLRYPDFLSCELMDLMSSNNHIDKSEIKSIFFYQQVIEYL